MAATALYRKWRPKRFADIVGQDPIVQTLRNAVLQEKIAHAYLFSGPRGTGKTSTGRILAKAINLPHDDQGEPETDSDAARAFDDGRHLDLLEIDAASNRGIDDIRELRERANYVPTSARFKVYLIDEAHQLTGAAADALLKTLEEPPPHVVFILATTDPQELKATILSRCQRYDFRRLSTAHIVGRLRLIAETEGITVPDDALTLLAREATGSLRDAINLLDQVWASHGDTLTLDDVTAALGLSSDARALDLARAALAKDLKAGLGVIAAVQDDAVDLGRFNKQVIAHLRHALLLQSGAGDILELSEPERAALNDLAAAAGPADTAPARTTAALRAFGSADLRSDPYAALPLELALAGLVYDPKPVAVAPAPTARGKSGARKGGKSDRPAGGGRGRRPDAPAPRGERRAGGAPGRDRAGGAPSQDRTGGAPGSDRSTPDARREPPPSREVAAAPAATKTPPRQLSPEEQLLAGVIAKLDEVRVTKRLAAYIRGACTLSQEGDTITLAFRPSYQDLHKGKVNEQAQVVAAAASEILGRPITLLTAAADEQPKQRSRLAAVAEEEHGLKRVRPRD